jgi:hypothetical protein
LVCSAAGRYADPLTPDHVAALYDVNKLTPNQFRAFCFLVNFHLFFGFAPTYHEAADWLGYRNLRPLQKVYKALRARGLVYLGSTGRRRVRIARTEVSRDKAGNLRLSAPLADAVVALAAGAWFEPLGGFGDGTDPVESVGGDAAVPGVRGTGPATREPAGDRPAAGVGRGGPPVPGPGPGEGSALGGDVEEPDVGPHPPGGGFVA